MDGFDFHPYPVPQTQPFAQGYADQKEASVTNLVRIYQAFYDAFSGTPQKTIGQQAGGGVPISLNETGVQTGSGGKLGYTGSEVSSNAAGGVVGSYASQDFQSSWYRQMLNLLACDPNVAFDNIFHQIDESSLEGWQSGLYFADESAKKAAVTVQSWLTQTGGSCTGTVHPWRPTGITPALVLKPPATIGKAKTRGKSKPNLNAKPTTNSMLKGKAKVTVTGTTSTATTGHGKATGRPVSFGRQGRLE
jgi:hypothetical protein